jgi:beta-N-acetylhexosaminidase
MNLRQQIAQMLVMGFAGCTLDSQSSLAQTLSSEGLGGVLLFDKDWSTGIYGKNLKDQIQIQQLTEQLQYYAAQSKTAPLFVALDYEGGAVDRLTQIPGCPKTKKAIDLASLPEHAFDEEVQRMATTLKNLGFNLNFAPVVDLNLHANQGIIGHLGRSFSKYPKIVADLAGRFVDCFQTQGICCAYKHFPGHGSATADSHKGFVDITDSFDKEELVPYQLLFQQQRQVMVMTAHVIHRQFDDLGLPASLSAAILDGLLRQSLGYEGVIISDDLQMQAITDHFSINDALVLSINAGADMLIFGNQLGFIEAVEVIDRIEALVLAGKISPARISEAYLRVMRLKQGL